MTGQNQKKQDDLKRGVSPMVAAVTGAVVGAGAVVAGVAALKDEKNRKKVKATLTNIKNQAKGYMEDMQKQAQNKKDEVEEKFTDVKEKAEDVANSAKDSLNQEVKDAKKAAHIR